MLSNAIEHEYHQATKHSLMSVQLDPNYGDARTQPTSFKTYPHFLRRFPFDLSNPIHRFLSLTSAITYQKQYRDSTHLLRIQPSAGALYPTELYVQLRGIRCMLDGIIARDSAVVFFIVSAYHNYRVALQQAGLVGQRIYLAATALNLGCSGIESFYADEMQQFLATDRPVLYTVAIGQI